MHPLFFIRIYPLNLLGNPPFEARGVNALPHLSLVGAILLIPTPKYPLPFLTPQRSLTVTLQTFKDDITNQVNSLIQ